MDKPDGRCGKREDWSRAQAICPYYRSENRQKIRCNGFLNISAINPTFTSKKEKQEYQALYCDKNWAECPIAKIIEEENK